MLLCTAVVWDAATAQRWETAHWLQQQQILLGEFVGGVHINRVKPWALNIATPVQGLKDIQALVLPVVTQAITWNSMMSKAWEKQQSCSTEWTNLIIPVLDLWPNQTSKKATIAWTVGRAGRRGALLRDEDESRLLLRAHNALTPIPFCAGLFLWLCV